ncbi:rab3 GTPase-activating protein non-catalytic subunit [Fopius arisanus]|uniref:Rab3 GTPase-activating protein non-catalytic subunit n=1 Tax=Fopius arisanus TaxID=64838 RepID=A0A9R1TJV2_9HYME|nr:PREDICTED: rab3 GTPase-activating protein non-catalytic subunit [Fopius arisanus]
MSCQMSKIAYLTDLKGIRAKLLQNAITKLDHVPKEELPLQDCLLSLSSVGDVLVLALHQHIVILTSKWDLQEPGDVKSKFSTTWSGCLTTDTSEYITSVLCLPLGLLGKSTIAGGVDWTCIAVGFSTGFIRFYTDLGCLLLEEQLHPETLISLKCQSSPAGHGDTSPSEEIHVLYPSAICVLPGFPLFSTLRLRRNHLAQVQANSLEKPLEVSNGASLPLRKFGFKDQDVINDCEFVGTTSVNTFDHLMTASVCGGFNASYRSSAPQHSLTIATGKRPYLGFHYALEGGAAPVLSDMALAMASSLASAIGRIGTAVPWLRTSIKPTKQNPPQDRKGPAAEAPESMTCRFALSDVMREGDCLVPSPNRALSVVADGMGRVLLLDNRKGLALRMWKGYRDAQCGWVEVSEDKHSNRSSALGDLSVCNKTHKTQRTNSRHSLKTALFLVIYAPKKSVIDVWGVQQGGKITTFTTSKNGRLIYINYGLLGVSDTTNPVQSRRPHSCVFLDSMGGLKNITVPFHYALGSKNGKRARDIHLFKKLKTFMREIDFDEETLVSQVDEICSELNTNEVRLQVIEMLMGNRRITPYGLWAATGCFSRALLQVDYDELGPKAKTLYRVITQLDKVIRFYNNVKPWFDQPPEYSTVDSSCVPVTKDLAHALLTSHQEVDRILQLSRDLSELESVKSHVHKKGVTFKDDGELFFNFISSFDFGPQISIGLREGLSEDQKYQIATLICQGWIYSSESTDEWKVWTEDSGIRPRSLVELALVYWLRKLPGAPLEVELSRFSQLLHTTCDLKAVDDSEDDREISSWWVDIRGILMGSSRPFQALTAALACRSVEIRQQNRRDMLSNYEMKGAIPEGWKNLSNETCQFTLLIGNLEDVALLNAITNQPIFLENSHKKFYALPYQKIDVSMGYVISRGKGSISEIVAKWLSSSGIDPEALIEEESLNFCEKKSMVEDPSSSSGEDTQRMEQNLGDDGSKGDRNVLDVDPILKEIFQKISLLRQHFPYSLTGTVLLANLAWEFVVHWSKNVTDLEALKAALDVLRKIPSKGMRHGVCCLLWNIHVKKRMETVAKLMNKLGKLPKERLCVQEIGLSDCQLTVFLQHCVSLLDIFLDSEIVDEENDVAMRFEELWEGTSSAPQPFTVLALTQPPAGFDLVMLHFQLANVLHMVARFNLKSVKLMVNLFDSASNQYFFQDISDKTVLAWYRDDKRDGMRMEFLCKVITASIEAIHQKEEAGDACDAEAVAWMAKCQTMAALWKIDKDKLRIHQVYQLYVNGLDRQADEISMAINNTESLAVNLLPVAGRRMMIYLSQTPSLLEQVSRISPSLTHYLEQLNIQCVIMSTSSHDATIELIQKLARYLPETHKDYHIAQLMLDATFIYEEHL